MCLLRRRIKKRCAVGCAAVGEERALRMRRAPCAAVGEERALRMRRAPCGYCGYCGCAPYGGVRSMIVGHDHRACRPRSGRQYRQTGLYAIGSSCTGAPSRRALRVLSKAPARGLRLPPPCCIYSLFSVRYSLFTKNNNRLPQPVCALASQ